MRAVKKIKATRNVLISFDAALRFYYISFILSHSTYKQIGCHDKYINNLLIRFVAIVIYKFFYNTYFWPAFIYIFIFSFMYFL